MITQLFPGVKEFESIEDCIDNSFIGQECRDAYSERNIYFLDELSKSLLCESKARIFPEVVAFAFWLRKGNIRKMLSGLNKSEDILVVPRGVAFHITPSNVDIMFLYSWALSLLCGNINIVRISHNESALVAFVMQHLTRLVSEREFTDVEKLNRIITYERNESINVYLSRMSDLRIIWGGDATVTGFKALPTPPHCKDICFPDRFSFSVINSSKYLTLSEEQKKTIAEKFYNDSFWFDQMACSSPQVVFFVGDDLSNSESSKHFQILLDEVIKVKGYEKPPSNVMDHLVRWCFIASEEVQESYKNITQDSSTFIKTTILKLNHEYKTCGGGFFLECHIQTIEELRVFNSKKDQTMTYYGFEKEDLVRLATLKGSNSPCRLIPIGAALNFDYVWDGYDLLSECTKAISITKA